MPSNPDASDRASRLEPEDASRPPARGQAASSSDADATGDAASLDPNDEIPVPIAMSAAEIDERAQIVEALRGKSAPSLDDESRIEP